MKINSETLIIGVIFKIIGSYWKLIDIEAMLLEIKIKDPIAKESIYRVLKLQERYRRIPTNDGKERNKLIDFRIKKYEEYYKKSLQKENSYANG
jgi:hypothetical protein